MVLLEDISESSLESSEVEDSSVDLGEDIGERRAMLFEADPMEEDWWAEGVPNATPEASGRTPSLPPLLLT